MKLTWLHGIVVLALAVPGAGPVWGLQVRSHGIRLDQDGENYNFLLVFDRTPRLTTSDREGRQTDGFQIWINRGGWCPFTAMYDTQVVIRGEDILSSGGIVIRQPALPETAPIPTGWGGNAGQVPFSVVGTALRFQVPRGLIDDDGLFSYRLQARESGVASGPGIWGTTPEPATLSLVACGGMLALRRRR